MIEKLRKFYSPPHFEGDENLSRAAFALHYTLFGTGTVIAAYFLLILMVNSSLYPRLFLIAAIFPIIFLSRWLMHQGRVRLASQLFVIALFSVMASQAIKNGGVHAPAFNGLFLVVLAAYILLGFRSGVVFALITILTGSGLIIAERYEWISPVVQAHTSVSFLIAHLIYLVGALALLYLTSRTVERSQIQARHADNVKEEALVAQRQSEIRYQAIVEDQSEFINRFTPDGTVLFVNEAYARLFNKRPEELIGQSQKSFLPKRELKNIAEAQSILSPDNPVTMSTYRFITSNGEERWIQWRDQQIFDGSGKTLEHQGVGRDITEQKRSQIALQESEERFRAVFEHSPSPIIMLFLETMKFAQANPAFSEMVGYSLEELRELSLSQILHPDDLRDSIEGVKRLAEDANQLFSTEKRYITKSGDTVWVSSNTTIIRDQEGISIYGLAVEQNITERKQSEVTVQKQLSELSTLHAVSSVGLESLDEDELIERVTKIIGEMLYPDHFGVLLLDEARGELLGHPSYHGLPQELLGIRIKHGAGISGQVVQTQKPLRYDDVLNVENFIRSTPGIRSAICVPISVSGQLYGVLNAESKQVAFFSDDDERVLITIADLLATAIEKARLYKASQSLAQELESLYQAALATSRLVEPKQFLAHVYEEIQKSIPLDRLFVLLHHEDNEDLEIALAIEDDIVQEEIYGQHYSITSEIPSVRAIQRGETVLLPEITSDEFPTLIKSSTGKIPKSLLSVPLIYGERVIGTICVQSFQSHTYTKDHQRFLESLAPQVSTAFINDQLFLAEKHQRALAEALHDSATVIGSTLDFKEVLERILANVGRVVPHDAANIMIIDDGNLTTTIIASRGYESVGITHEELAVLEFQLADPPPTLARMIQTRQPFIITDVHTDENWMRFPETAWIKSYIGAPIIIEDAVIGFINLDSAQENFFASTHAESLEAFANQVAIAIENARLYQELEKHSLFLEQEVNFATEEIQQSKERLETILDNSPNAILLLSPEGVIEISNKTFENIFQYTSEEVLGQSLSILAAPESKAECNKILQEVVIEHEPKRLECTAATKGNRPFDVELALVPIQLDDTVYGIVSTLRDISALKEVERLKDEFVSNVSHELRTPLTSLKLNQGLIRMNPEKQDVYLQRLDNEINRLNNIVESLLRLSRLDQEKLSYQKTTVDLNELITEYAQDRGLVARSKSIALIYEVDPRMPKVKGDRELLGQALSVLLTNALNYTPMGGQVRLYTQRKRENRTAWSCFCVEDNGPGISDDDKSLIFQRFYRGAAAKDGGIPGTGLGLAIAKEIVEQHQGHIVVESGGEGVGTTFTVWLPALHS
ncbi:MAG: PAS domain S-box protein [Anaerolineales bacterium]